MRTLVRRAWFFAGIAVVVAAAFLFPELGHAVRRYRVLHAAIFLAFLVTGASLDARAIREQLRNARTLLAAAGSALLLVPVGAYVLARLAFPDVPDFVVGVTLIAAAPVTLASGTVMTTVALGNVALSLFICIAVNLAGLLTMPAVLALLLRLGETVRLPVLEVFGGLALTILLPVALGQAIRPRVRRWLGAWTSPFQQGVVLLIIFNAVSSSADRVAGAGGILAALAVFTFALRLLVLALNYGIARALRLDPPSTSAFTIHVSQKTLTVSYLVWSGYFAAAYPLAMLPGIVYHLTQMAMDTLLARLFRRHAQRRPSAS